MKGMSNAIKVGVALSKKMNKDNQKPDGKLHAEKGAKSVKKNTMTMDFSTLSAEEIQNSLYKELKNFSIFKVQENAAPSAPRDLCEDTEATYIAIWNSAKAESEKGDNDKFVIQRVSNFKVTRKTLISYLRKHYAARVATKMACIFDWSNT